MVKPALNALLVVLCLLLVKANITTFRPPSPPKEEVATKKNRAKKIGPLQPLMFNPQRGRELPDLSSAYLFNGERFLAQEGKGSKIGKGQGQDIQIEDVVFNGALLGEGYKSALVSYNPAKKTVAHTIKRAGAKKQMARRPETIQLTVGEQLGGFTVKEITPDFILFIKGSETIKKTLFSSDKNRQHVGPRTPATPPPSKTFPGVVPPRRIKTAPMKRP